MKKISRATNLHDAWDSGIIEAKDLTNPRLIGAAAVMIIDRDGEPAASRTRYDEWATESFNITKRIVYPRVEDDGEITESDSRDATGVIEEWIAYAGIRLG